MHDMQWHISHNIATDDEVGGGWREVCSLRGAYFGSKGFSPVDFNVTGTTNR